jgi:hypothetical protein
MLSIVLNTQPRRSFESAVTGYTGIVDDVRPSSGLVSEAWRRIIDGDRPWGSIDIRPDRFGVTRYLLVVYPPGISASERRRVRLARGWPLWGAVVWIFCEIFGSQLTGPWTALAVSTSVYLGLGVIATMNAGEPRRRVRTIAATVMVGYFDPAAAAARDRLQSLAVTLLGADERLARGEISPATHEMEWWRVYDQISSGHSSAAAA